MNIRIIERVYPDGEIVYVIQRRFLWIFWCDISDDYRYERYSTLEEARENLCWYDGTKNQEKIVW